MFNKQIRANDLRVKTFNSDICDELETIVNEWLKNQSDDIVVQDIIYSHSISANPEIGVNVEVYEGFSVAIVYSIGAKAGADEY